MKSDICLCAETREAHEIAAAALTAAMKGQKVPTLPVTCAQFRLDRKATWHAELGKKFKRTVSLITGCPVCGAQSNRVDEAGNITSSGCASITWVKDHSGKLVHQGCPGPKP